MIYKSAVINVATRKSAVDPSGWCRIRSCMTYSTIATGNEVKKKTKYKIWCLSIDLNGVDSNHPKPRIQKRYETRRDYVLIHGIRVQVE